MSTVMPDRRMPSAREAAGGHFICPEVGVVVITSADMLLTSAQAAEVAGVTKKRVLQWDRRGHLERAGLDEQGRALYRALDVAKCQRRFHGYARNEAA